MSALPAKRNITCQLDVTSSGKRAGHLMLRHSDNRHAYSIIPIPIGVIVGRPGPTMLLTAGTHGDEYEGQAILRRLFWETDAEEVEGRIIVLPALNYPAVRDGTRVSPLDGGNLNRAYPGTEEEGPTAAIADYLARNLLPLCDAGFDIHSGGSTAVYLPSAYVCTNDDGAIDSKNMRLAALLNTKHVFRISGNNFPDSLDAEAHRLGVPLISAELAGGGTLSKTCSDLGLRGVRNMLRDMGILPGEPETPVAQINLDGDNATSLAAERTGIFEPSVQLGDEVEAGQSAGMVFPLDDILTPAEPIQFSEPGIVYSIRQPALVRPGDYLLAVAPRL